MIMDGGSSKPIFAVLEGDLMSKGRPPIGALLILDEEVWSWVRGRALERGCTISEFIFHLLRERMMEDLKGDLKPLRLRHQPEDSFRL